MVTLGDLLILATPQGATMVRKMGGEILTFMGLQIAGKCICGNCAP